MVYKISMRKNILFRDKAGNTAYKEGAKLAVRNRQGKLVTMGETINFLKRHPKVMSNIMSKRKSVTLFKRGSPRAYQFTKK